MNPYILDGDNKVIGIKKENDIYIVEGVNFKGQAHSIQIHPDGSIRNYKGGQTFEGHVEKSMVGRIGAILAHFEVKIPNLQKPQEESFIKTFDLPGGNKVTGIETKDDMYIVNALNNNHELRSIQVHFDGSITNYQGGSDFKGYVEKILKENIEAIFKHFNVPFPTAKTVQRSSPPSSHVSGEHPSRNSHVSGEHPSRKSHVSGEHPSRKSHVSGEHPSRKSHVSGEHPSRKSHVSGEHPSRKSHVSGEDSFFKSERKHHASDESPSSRKDHYKGG